MLAYVPTARVLAFASMKTKDYKRLAADRIKAARGALRDDRGGKISQRKFAELVPGLGSGRLGNYEAADRYPGPEVFAAIAEETGEPAAYLSGLVDGDEAKLLRALARMDAADRKDVMDYVLRRKSLAATELTDFGVDPPPEETTTKSQKKRR